MLRARHAAVLSTDPASLQQRQALLAANQPPVTSSGHEDANPIPNPDAHASDRFVPPAFSNSPVIGNLLSRRELSVTLNRSTARQMRAADDSGLDLNQGDANRGVLSSGAVRQSFPRRIVETSGNGTRYRLSQASERNPVPSDEEPGLDPGFRRGLSLDAPGLGEASEDLTYPPSRLGFRGLWGRAHQWQQNVHRRSIGDGSQSARQHTETETGT